MKIIILKNLQEWAEAAAVQVARQIKIKPNSVLGLATGNTTLRLHETLVRMAAAAEIDFSAVVTFNLDEYVGIPRDHPASCRFRIEAQLLNNIPIARENIHLPDGQATSLEAECQRYEHEIEQHGGIDLQILGIGTNGHIGFNEPGTPFESVTHIAEIESNTQAVKSSFFGTSKEAPRQGISMGIKTIMQAQKIMLLACGNSKTDIIARALTGPITPEVPASVLQLHPNLLALLDEQAAEKLGQR